MKDIFQTQRPQIYKIERETKKIRTRVDFDSKVPVDVVKERAIRCMADNLKTIAEWDIKDSLEDYSMKTLVCTIYIAAKS